MRKCITAIVCEVPTQVDIAALVQDDRNGNSLVEGNGWITDPPALA